MLVQKFIRTDIKENTKVLHCWPFMRGIHQWPGDSNYIWLIMLKGWMLNVCPSQCVIMWISDTQVISCLSSIPLNLSCCISPGQSHLLPSAIHQTPTGNQDRKHIKWKTNQPDVCYQSVGVKVNLRNKNKYQYFMSFLCAESSQRQRLVNLTQSMPGVLIWLGNDPWHQQA